MKKMAYLLHAYENRLKFNLEFYTNYLKKYNLQFYNYYDIIKMYVLGICNRKEQP